MQLIFDKDYELTYSHIDWRGTARPSAYFDFMQVPAASRYCDCMKAAATVHARSCHLDRDDIGALWVLSRMHAEFTRPLAPYDTLRVTTWCAGIKGPSWLRAFEFSVDGQPAGRAMSSWVILDAETHRIRRPTTVPQAADYACEERERVNGQAGRIRSVPAPHSPHPVFRSGREWAPEQRPHCGTGVRRTRPQRTRLCALAPD